MLETKELEEDGQTTRRQYQGRVNSAGLRQFSWWWLTSSLAAGLALGIGFLYIVRLIAQPFALLILSIAIATSLAPLVQKLQARLRISRSLAAILVFLLVILFLVVLGSIIVPGLVLQGQAFIERIPSYIETANTWLAQWNVTDQESLTNTLFNQLGTITGRLVALPITLFTSLLDVFLILFMALYWLILMPSMKAFFLSLFPQQRQDRIDQVLNNMGQAMGGYIRGSLINGVIVGMLTYIGLLIIGVDYALVLGMLAAVLEIVPVLGPLLAGIVIVATALVESPRMAIIAAVYMLVMQQAESNILVPYVMRSQADLSPLLVLVAVFVAGTLGGLVWALAAIPLVAGLNVFVRQVIIPAVRRSTGAAAVEDD